MSRLLLRLGVLALATSLAVSVASGQTTRQHYNEYDFDVHPNAMAPPFTLADQWGVTTHSFAIYDRFLAPTSQDADPIVDQNTFLTRYFIGFGGEPPRHISVTNKFREDQDWTIQESLYLLNPSLKNAPGGGDPPTANHYKCYVANGPFIGQTVTLGDQFGTYQVLITEPAVWCNPAEKQLQDGQTFPVVDEFAWLGCYFTDPPSAFDPPMPVRITDQFGTTKLGLVSREVLCVPSFKAPPVPVETTSWGDIKATYR